MKIKRWFSLILCLIAFHANGLELTLQECKKRALESSELIKIADNRVIQSDLDKSIATSAYFPKIDGNASAFYMTPNSSMGDAMELSMRGVYLAGFSLMQPIYTGGKIYTANKLAKVGKEASQKQKEALVMDVLADAEKSYWNYVAVKSKISMIQAYLTQLDSILQFTQTAYDLGMTTRLSVSRVESRISELDYRLRQAKSGEELCRLSLCRIIGVGDNEEIEVTEHIDDSTQFLMPWKGIEERPELQLAKLNIDAKKYDVKMVLSDYLPTIGLQIGWNAFGNLKMTNYVDMGGGVYYPFTQSISYKGFVGAISLSVPIFHWGEGYKKVKKAKIEVENANLELERNKKLMELQAHQAYSNYIDGIDLIKSAIKAFEEADLNLSMMKDQYEAGLMTLTDFLDAQSQWHSSYSNMIEAKTQFRINRVEYLRSIGEID